MEDSSSSLPENFCRLVIIYNNQSITPYSHAITKKGHGYHNPNAEMNLPSIKNISGSGVLVIGVPVDNKV